MRLCFPLYTQLLDELRTSGVLYAIGTESCEKRAGTKKKLTGVWAASPLFDSPSESTCFFFFNLSES